MPIKSIVSKLRSTRSRPAAPPAPSLLERANEMAEAGQRVEAIELLESVNRQSPDPEVDIRLLSLRSEAFGQVRKAAVETTVWPPETTDRFGSVRGLPEVDAADLDGDALRAGIFNHGALIVRGLLSGEQAAGMAQMTDDAISSLERQEAGDEAPRPGADFVPFEQPGAEDLRGWVYDAGGVLAVESPRAMNELLAIYDSRGLREVLTDYLGERPALSARKSTLRRVPQDLKLADWHQDGAFLGEEIRSLNVWVALTRCGGDIPTPGLSVIPQRLDALLPTGTFGAWFPWSVSPEIIAERELPIEQPVFEAGDALLFDEMFLHRSAIGPDMTHPRYAIESWFFAPTAYPKAHFPIVF